MSKNPVMLSRQPRPTYRFVVAGQVHTANNRREIAQVLKTFGAK